MTKCKTAKVRRKMIFKQDLFNDGGPGCTPIPNEVLNAFLNRQMPEAKFRLLCVMLSHSETFHIKRRYLTDTCRFDSTTLKKYTAELEAEGYITRELVPCDHGGNEVIYHVNSLWDWDLYKKSPKWQKQRLAAIESDEECEPEHDDREGDNPPCSAISDRVATEGRQSPQLNNTKANKTDLNPTHTQSTGQSKKAKAENQKPEANPYQSKAAEFAEKLKREHRIVADPSLLAKYLGLIHQADRKKDLAWMESRFPEWSLYLAARKDPRFDPGLALFNWAKHYREPMPQKTNQKSTSRPKQPTVLTDEFITKPEDLEGLWND